MMILTVLLPLLPLFSLSTALQLPHFPTSPQQALQAADQFLHPGHPGGVTGESPLTRLSPASDISLSTLGKDEFFTITSAAHPGHSVRIKETTGWCDPDVRSFTG